MRLNYAQSVAIQVVLVWIVATSGVQAQQTRFESGQTATGAYYRYAVPAGWQPADGLVLWNHGFDLGAVEPDPDLGPLLDYQLAQGFAVAASSYSLNGWALFQTREDLRELVEAFTQAEGEPESLLVAGGSLGGIVSAQAAEDEALGNVTGAYLLCPPLQGSRVWQSALDLRLVYDAVCDGVDGGELPGGAGGLPFALDPDQLDGTLGEIGVGLVGAAIQVCTGYGLPSALVTSSQQERYDRIVAATGVTDEFFEVNMGYATFALSDLVRDDAKLGDRSGLSNLAVTYPDAGINGTIDRVDADPFAALDLNLNFTPTGRVSDTKIVSTHTDGDGLVLVEHQSAYAKVTPANRLTQAIVVEDEPSHCGYTIPEVVAGWDELLDWIATDIQPDPQDIQDRCLETATNPLFAGECRYEPNYQVADINTRVLPRPEPTPVDERYAGQWFTPGESGHGWFMEMLEDNRALVFWFNYPPEGEPGRQSWYWGVGNVVDNAVVVDEAQVTSGAVFGADFDPDAVVREPWGSMRFVFDQCGEGQLEYSAPEPFGSDRLAAQQITNLSVTDCAGATAKAVPQGYSGSFFNPARNGEGFLVQTDADGRTFVIWFTYDAEGNQAWLYGEAMQETPTGFVAPMIITEGGVFGSSFNAADVQRITWGELEFAFDGCDAAVVTFTTEVVGFESGTTDVVRLTQPVGLPDTCAR